MNWLELGRIDLIGWYLFVVDGGRELPEMTSDLDENFAGLTLASGRESWREKCMKYRPLAVVHNLNCSDLIC